MVQGGARIEQPVRDISDSEQLIRYALSAQLEHILLNRTELLSQARIAYAARLGSRRKDAGARLSTLLRSETLTMPTLQRLDEAIGALTQPEVSIGGLASLAVRLRDKQTDTTGLTAHVPASWARQVLSQHAESEIGALTQASALLSAFQVADRVHESKYGVADVSNWHSPRIPKLMDQLTLIAAGPPTPRNIDAQILLGSLASYMFDRVQKSLDEQLRKWPLGFRVWRAVTKLVKLSHRNDRHIGKLQTWVRTLLQDAESIRESSIYPGRSLDLELAIIIPHDWTSSGDDWAAEALKRRALNTSATLRERGTAALGLWQRAQATDRNSTEGVLRGLIDQMSEYEARPDLKSGIQWVIQTLSAIMDEGEAVCNNWPLVEENWFDVIQSAKSELISPDVPAHLREGTARLFEHALLQNAGVYRRHAVETLVTAGMIEPVTRALGYVLKNEPDESWVRIRALFALGFLQSSRDRHVADHLIQAVSHGYSRIISKNGPTQAQVNELHTALFAVGDCFGASGAEKHAAAVRDELTTTLNELVENEMVRRRELFVVARATAYLLAVTAQPSKQGPDLSHKLLDKLQHHPDHVTRDLCKWALSFRFADDESVRPLLAAADLRPGIAE